MLLARRANIPKSSVGETMNNNKEDDGKDDVPRFYVEYIVEAESDAHARKVGWECCLEQTVELPGHLQQVRDVETYTVGTVEKIQPCITNGDQTARRHTRLYRITIGYPDAVTGYELPQFLNVVFGNSSLKRGISVADVTLSPRLEQDLQLFPGPKFGISGIRKLLGIPQAPLLMTALKPLGKSSKEFADMAYALAKGGVDIIKDDHGLSNQEFSPFEERVKLCSDAVHRVCVETGKKALYAPCVNAPVKKIFERAYYAQSVGCGAVMVLPGLCGWDVVRELASSQDFNLPIIIHPAFLDDIDESIDNPTEHPHGLSHQFLYGKLPRICGGDAVIFPNASGRFHFTNAECMAIASSYRSPLGRFESIWPTPAGGMKLNRIDEMRRGFGDDTLFLIGGALLEQGHDLEKDARLFAHCCGRDQPYSPVGSNITSQKVDAAKSSSDDDTQPSIAKVNQIAHKVRRRVLEYTLYNNGGYLSQACSSAETLATLYLRALNLGQSVASSSIPGPFRGSPGPTIETITGECYNGDFTDPSLDRLIFSPVHYACVLYALLVEVGRLDQSAFDSYNKDGSTVELIGAEHSPGHALTAGSLAQAISQASGIAYARKLKGHTGRVVVYMSDGEFQEGQLWEAVEAAVFHKIGNLVAVVDVNGQQCDGKMEDVMEIGNLTKKLSAFGAIVKEVDGHSVTDIERAMNETTVDRNLQRPTFVLCYTDPCKGFLKLRELAPKLHYVRFKSPEEKEVWAQILGEMEIPADTEYDAINKGTIDDMNIVESHRKRKQESVACEEAAQAMTEDSGAMADVAEASSVYQNPEVSARPHRTNLVSWMKRHPKAIVLTADLTSSCEADLLRDEQLPNQYLSMGMAEQNMMSFAGGLAREGFHPFVHTFAVFVTRRPYDQVAMSIGVPNLPVRLLGFLPGLTTPGGVTHQAIDDVALMRSIPNMRILEVGDATEVESVLDIAESIPGPVYIRMWRGLVPRLFDRENPMKFRTARLLSEGVDIALVTYGICTEEALKVTHLIEEKGLVSIHHLHLSTLVPFPGELICDAARKVRYGIIVMENHSVVGGIGSATAEVIAEEGIGKKLIRLGVPGVYAHGASCGYLMKEYGFDKTALVKASATLTGKQELMSLVMESVDGTFTGLKKEHGHESDRFQSSCAEARNIISSEDRPEDL